MAMACVTGCRECDGCMACQSESEYRCPVCGEELSYDEKVYSTYGGVVVGCCHCLEEQDAEDAL